MHSSHLCSLSLALLLAAGCSPPRERPGGRPGGPTIAVEPLAGPPGTDVRVSANGLPPDVTVDVGFGPPGSEFEVIARTNTDGDGSTAAAVRVPAGAASGRPYVFVVSYPPTLLRLVSDTFRVTAGAPPAPPPDTGAAAPPPAGELRVTGRLTDEGVECPALRADDGKLYTLAGDTGGFRVGDRVTVTGTVAEMSTCMQGTTIEVRTIERAS